MKVTSSLRESSRPAAGFEGYPVDADFPQLEIASDPGLMLEVFRAHLKPVRGKSCRILDCTPVRFRCRESTARCVLLYVLRVVEPGTGRQWDQWVTGLIYADEGEARRLWCKLGTGEAAHDIPPSRRCFEPVSYIPDIEMVVEVFPYDRRLPQLGRILSGAARDLDPLLLARLGPGSWRAGESTIEPKRYRTELGAVLRYAVSAHDQGGARHATPSCYLKVYRNDRGRETFAFLRAWLDSAHATSRDYVLVQPLAYMNELRTLVLEEAPGRSLRDTLLGPGDPVGPARTVARATAALNQERLPIARRHTLEDQIDQLRRSSMLLQWACPEVRSEIRGVTAAVVAELEEVVPAPCHRDLTPEHAFLSGDRTTFVDVDSIAVGDPVRDAARLVAHIASSVTLDAVPPERARVAAAAFVDEYFAHVPWAWRKRFRPHCVGAFVELAASVFRSQVPAWRDKVHRAAADARRALAGEFG